MFYEFLPFQYFMILVSIMRIFSASLGRVVSIYLKTAICFLHFFYSLLNNERFEALEICFVFLWKVFNIMKKKKSNIFLLFSIRQGIEEFFVFLVVYYNFFLFLFTLHFLKDYKFFFSSYTDNFKPLPINSCYFSLHQRIWESPIQSIYLTLSQIFFLLILPLKRISLTIQLNSIYL